MSTNASAEPTTIYSAGDNHRFTEAFSSNTHRSALARPWSASIGGNTRYYGSLAAARRRLCDMDISRPQMRRICFETSPGCGVVVERF